MSDGAASKWIRYLEFWRRDPRRDVEDEIQFHLDARIADLIARGLSPSDARADLGEWRGGRRG